MIVHEIPGYWSREGGEWITNPDGMPINVGGLDVWIEMPPEWHTDDCPCQRCQMTRAANITISEDEVGVEPVDPELTPEDIKRLEEHNER